MCKIIIINKTTNKQVEEKIEYTLKEGDEIKKINGVWCIVRYSKEGE